MSGLDGQRRDYGTRSSIPERKNSEDLHDIAHVLGETTRYPARMASGAPSTGFGRPLLRRNAEGQKKGSKLRIPTGMRVASTGAFVAENADAHADVRVDAERGAPRHREARTHMQVAHSLGAEGKMESETANALDTSMPRCECGRCTLKCTSSIAELFLALSAAGSF